MGDMLKLENLTFGSIWNALVVLIVLALLFFGIYKGIIMIRDDINKRKDEKKINKKDITDEIANKVMDKLKPQIDEKFAEFSRSVDMKFEEIDNKLKSDKDTLALHTTQLNDHESRVSKLEGANYSLCHGMLALLERDPALTKEQKAMKNYLIDGKYNEEDWK